MLAVSAAAVLAAAANADEEDDMMHVAGPSPLASEWLSALSAPAQRRVPQANDDNGRVRSCRLHTASLFLAVVPS